MKQLTFHRALLQAAEQRGERKAFVENDREEDLATHTARSLQLVNALQAAGVQRGDRLLVLANASRYVINVMHAAALGGWIAVPVNPAFTQPELAHAVDDSAPSVIFADPQYTAKLHDVLTEIGLSARVVVIDDAASGKPAVARSTLSSLIASASAGVPDEPAELAPVCMLYTGGTTGTPKGALCTNRQLMIASDRMLDLMEVGVDSTLLSVNPLFHMAAMPAIYFFALAAQAVVLRSTPVPEQVFADAARHRVTHLGVVVPILQRLMAHPAFDPADFRSLRSLTYGASPMPAELLDRVRQLWPDVVLQQSYGMTEAFCAVTSLSDADHRAGGRLLGSVGRATVGTKVTIRDPDGAVLPVGQPGEVCIDSETVTTRYWGDPLTEHQAPYLRSGDAGRLDADGYLFLLDRLKDMIKTGGENVFSIEVERVLQSHPDVQSVAVIGLPSERWGEQVHAVVVVKPGAMLGEAELQEFARTQLAGYKIPKTIAFQQEPLPVTAIGKTLKRALRQRYVETG